MRVAGRKLRRQAIERTVQEIEEPLDVWGIRGTPMSGGNGGLGSAWIREHAERRLRVLEGLR